MLKSPNSLSLYSLFKMERSSNGGSMEALEKLKKATSFEIKLTLINKPDVIVSALSDEDIAKKIKDADIIAIATAGHSHVRAVVSSGILVNRPHLQETIENLLETNRRLLFIPNPYLICSISTSKSLGN